MTIFVKSNGGSIVLEVSGESLPIDLSSPFESSLGIATRVHEDGTFASVAKDWVGGKQCESSRSSMAIHREGRSLRQKLGALLVRLGSRMAS